MQQKSRPADADAKLRQTWESVWRTGNVEREHLDAIAEDGSDNTLIFRPHIDRMLARYARPTVL